MRCEDVLAALATGGRFRRRWARRHAARCPRCAASAAFLGQVASDLSDVPPLSPSDRALWASACEVEPALKPVRQPWARLVLAASLAAAVVLGIVFGLRDRQDPERLVAQGSTVPGVTQKTLPKVNDPPFDLTILEREIDEVRRLADLLEARREADALWARHAPRRGT